MNAQSVSATRGTAPVGRYDALLVGDERGGRYVLDLRTHRVSQPAR
jgi:hypothetical protein